MHLFQMNLGNYLYIPKPIVILEGADRAFTVLSASLNNRLDNLYDILQ